MFLREGKKEHAGTQATPCATVIKLGRRPAPGILVPPDCPAQDGEAFLSQIVAPNVPPREATRGGWKFAAPFGVHNSSGGRPENVQFS
jgi:hypothetical protein